MKACVVDDDYTSRILIGQFLEDEGWDVILFSHPDIKSEKGTQLNEELSDKSTKLLIMDVRFGRDAEGLRLGLNSVKYLAESNTLKPNCLVLFVSQFGRDYIEFSSVEEILTKKEIRVDWLDKPIDYVLLNETISQVK